ncbi:MAG: acetyl-CoA carboxylase biotin carboxyl carrier protein subunit [Calditrichaeota bacterium]|nr:MAG: acetyl-CoA carboxylase biotin carboxyl carrier protein subunit [Calditrichota bacterium]
MAAERFVTSVDNKKFDLRVENTANHYNTIIDGQRYSVEVLKQDSAHCVLKIDEDIAEFFINKSGEIYNVTLENKVASSTVMDHRIYERQQKSSGVPSDTQSKQLLSPMPGLIVDVLFKTDDEVEQGDSLLILEAMKMENVIKSPRKARIKNIFVEKNKSVEKDQILIEFFD